MLKRRNLLICFMCVVLAAVSSFNAVAFDWEGLDEVTETVDTEEKPQAVDELKVIAENDLARLYYNEATSELLFEVIGKGSFSSIVKPEYAGVDSDSAQNMRELFSFLVYNPENRATQSFSALDDGVELRFTKKDNGFDITVQKEDLSFAVCFRLNGENLSVSVPHSEIKEGKKGLVSVTLMPFLGAANTSEDGYIFYPDGSGTLYKFSGKPTVGRSAVTKLIYSDAMNELDGYMDDRAHNIMALTMPVFGIKKGNTLLFAEIGDGAADTSLTLAPSGYVYELARAYPTFNYRYSYFEKTVSGDSMLVFSDNPVKTDFSVSYSILSGDEADWIGMAKRVRQDLFDGNKITDIPNISVDLMMTTQKSLLLWDISRKVTDFADAERLLGTLKKSGVDGVRLNLLGWQSKGYNNYPAHLPVSRKAGGIKGLKNLTKTAAKTGATVQLLDNFAEGDFDGSGISIRREAAYNMQKKPLADTEQTKLLLDVGVGFDTFKKNIKKLSGTGINGYSFDLFGSLVYDNVASGRQLRRQEYIDKVNSYLELSNKEFGSSAVDGANYYALKNAGFIYNLPDCSSGEFIYDMDVPFLQMVLHGYRPYSGRDFGNFSNSVETAVLGWLEYGYVPAFVLGEESPSILKNTKSEGFFYSRIDDWTDTIGDIYKDFLPAYQKIKNQEISDYISMDKTREITYENGTKLLINYDDKPYEICGVMVEALSYEII